MNFMKSAVGLFVGLVMAAAQPVFAQTAPIQGAVSGAVAPYEVGTPGVAADGTALVARQVGNQTLWVQSQAVVIGQAAGVAAGSLGVTAGGIAATAVLFGSTILWVNSATGTTGTVKKSS